MKGRRLAALLATALLAVILVASTALGQTVRFGNLIVTIEGGVSPSRLSKRSPTPIALKVSGSIATADGSHVPALKTIALKFDRHGRIFTEGLPACTVAKLRNTLTARARRACGAALVGSGRVSAEIALPEQAPFSASGPLLIFNGVPRGGRPVLIFHVHASVPAPTTFVTEGVVGRASGRYGTSTLIQIPTIVGGQGSLTSFKATIHRTWTYGGRRRSLLAASCPTGHLYAHGEFDFASDVEISGNVARSCRPGG